VTPLQVPDLLKPLDAYAAPEICLGKAVG
jgi:hypothetical protein